MRVLGIDPGYATIGFSIIEADRGSLSLVQYGTITTSADAPFPQRLQTIYHDMQQLIDAANAEVMAIEELFWGHNVTTGIGVSHGRGVILLAAAEKNLPIYEYTPMQIKQAVVGYGNATKLQVMDMTKRLLKMEKVARPDDAADAIAVALCHARSSTSLLLGMNSR